MAEWIIVGLLSLALFGMVPLLQSLNQIAEHLRVIRNGVEYGVQTANQIINK